MQRIKEMWGSAVTTSFDFLAEVILPVVFVVLLVAAVFGGVVFIGNKLVEAFSGPPSPVITLDKDKWACTSLTRDTYTTFVRSGDIMVPVTMSDDRCTQWSRQP